MNILLSIGIAQGLFLVLLLFGKKENHRANLILATLIFLYSLFIGQTLAVSLEFYKTLPHSFAVFVGVPLLFGPIHYLYVRTLINSSSSLCRKDFLHFIPYFFNWLYFFPFLLKSKADLTIMFEKFIYEQPTNYTFVGLWVITTQGLVYMVLSLKMIKSYSLKIQGEFSSLEKINLTWLKNITIGTLLVWILVFIKNIASYFVSSDLLIKREIPIALGTSILIYAMGYMGLMQTEIFSPIIVDKDEKDKPESKEQNNLVKKYEKSGLTEEKSEVALNMLNKLMEEEKIYRESNLTLKDLAKRLSISPHNFSEIINTQLNQNFFDFINKYRVDDVKTALNDPQKSNYTLLAIALEAGFNSKSSFNAIFKKITGMTPSQYRKNSTDNS